MTDKTKKGARYKQEHKKIKQRQRAEKAQNEREAAAAKHKRAAKRHRGLLNWLKDKHKLVEENESNRAVIFELRRDINDLKRENAWFASELAKVSDKLNHYRKTYLELRAENKALRAALNDPTHTDITDGSGFACEDVWEAST